MKHSDGNWDELNLQERKRGTELATSSAQTVYPSGGSGREGGRDGDELGRLEL